MTTSQIRIVLPVLMGGFLGAAATLPPASLDPQERWVLQALIRFEPDRGEIRRGDEPALERLARFLLRHPDQRIEIQGHTDPYGTPEFKVAQGETYATSIRRWLEGRGVPSAQMETKSFGKERPRFRGQGRHEAMKNARCEFRLLAP